MLSLRSILFRQSNSLQRERMLRRLSMTVLFSSASLLVYAQTKPVRTQVYTFVEQMPQLPGGGGTQAISNEILKRLRPSGKIEPSCYRVMIYFEVNPIGAVQHARIIYSSQSKVIDSASLQAVRSLPKMRPGYQQGQPVTVSFTMPFSIATQ